MGCDIHAHLEYTYDGSRYEHWGELSLPRNYEMFAALAGVRGEGPKAKGVLASVSFLTEASRAEYGRDGHSDSWCTPVEMEKAILAATETLRKNYGQDVRNINMKEWYAVLGILEFLPGARLVFWFDN